MSYTLIAIQTITIILIIIATCLNISTRRIIKKTQLLKEKIKCDEQNGFYSELMDDIPNKTEDKRGYTWELIGILDENIVATYDNIVGELTIDDLFTKYDFIGDREHYRLDRIGLTVEENKS